MEAKSDEVVVEMDTKEVSVHFDKEEEKQQEPTAEAIQYSSDCILTSIERKKKNRTQFTVVTNL